MQGQKTRAARSPTRAAVPSRQRAAAERVQGNEYSRARREPLSGRHARPSCETRIPLRDLVGGGGETRLALECRLQTGIAAKRRLESPESGKADARI